MCEEVGKWRVDGWEKIGDGGFEYKHPTYL